MTNDFITYLAITKELSEKLIGARIDKVIQPSREDIVLGAYNNGTKYQIMISASSTAPRVHLTSQKFNSPQTAPAFCMHLRKYLLSSHIKNVQLLNNDRIVCFDIIAKDEMRYELGLKLILEIRSRSSNIILVNSDTISDCLYHNEITEKATRVMLSGAKYILPNNEKVSITDKEALLALFSNSSDIASTLKSSVNGLGTLSYQYISNSVKDSTNAIDYVTAIDELLSIATSDTKGYVVTKNDELCDYYIVAICDTNICFDSINEALDYYYSNKTIHSTYIQQQKHLARIIDKEISKVNKTINLCHTDIKKAENNEKFKRYADAIINSMYLLKNGMDSANVVDYSSENQEIITIPLDKQLTISQNAKKYYDRYNKLKRTIENSKNRIIELSEKLDILLSSKSGLELSNTLADLDDIKNDFISKGLIREVKTKGKQSKQTATTNYLTYNIQGTVVLVGKNNIQNDELTFHIARATDIWLHTKSYHGSHIIIKTDNLPNDDILLIAAEIAAYYSTADKQSKVQVDYTTKNNVKRHISRSIGLVNYYNYKTIVCSANNHKEYLVN